MASRLSLHEELRKLLGTRFVYFQPPDSTKMSYPAIVYNRSGVAKLNADDSLYKSTNRYDGVIIDSDPDSDIPDRLLAHFPMCTLGRSYPADNMNHTPFTLYY